jgi:hypothetical protein
MGHPRVKQGSELCVRKRLRQIDVEDIGSNQPGQRDHGYCGAFGGSVHDGSREKEVAILQSSAQFLGNAAAVRH